MELINAFFGKDGIRNKITKDDVEDFIQKKIEENINLDYKAIINNEIHYDKIAKVIASFGNAQGGLLILGINEDKAKRHYPKEITWYSGNNTREIIGQKIGSYIQPFLDFQIVAVRNEEKSIFLINVPVSDIAPHMVQNMYYNRTSYQSLPMDHHLVELYFNRRKSP